MADDPAMADGQTRVGDIARRLEDAYERVASERMAGIPILNPRLSVEVVGAREWEGLWLGVLVTPWSINLMLLPLEETQRAAWAGLAPGSAAKHRFPAGQFEFLVGEEADLGRTQMCSLFSPVLEFEGQDAARIAAEAALAALLDPAMDGAQPAPGPEADVRPDRPGNENIDLAQGVEGSSQRVSRRGFLSGRMPARTGSEGVDGKEAG